MYHNDANKMIPTPFHIRHSQNFGKIDIFLKSVLDIFIFHKWIVRWEEGVIKKVIL